MFKVNDREFVDLVYEIFGNTMQELGFEFIKEDKKLLYAKKGDIQLIFRLEIIPKVCLFSLEIMLLGELGERATVQTFYRSLDVTTIAKYSDPKYEVPSGIPSTENELRDSMELQKTDLLKYCKYILNGDVSLWSKIVDLITEESGWKPN